MAPAPLLPAALPDLASPMRWGAEDRPEQSPDSLPAYARAAADGRQRTRFTAPGELPREIVPDGFRLFGEAFHLADQEGSDEGYEEQLCAAPLLQSKLVGVALPEIAVPTVGKPCQLKTTARETGLNTSPDAPKPTADPSDSSDDSSKEALNSGMPKLPPSVKLRPRGMLRPRSAPRLPRREKDSRSDLGPAWAMTRGGITKEYHCKKTFAADVVRNFLGRNKTEAVRKRGANKTDAGAAANIIVDDSESEEDDSLEEMVTEQLPSYMLPKNSLRSGRKSMFVGNPGAGPRQSTAERSRARQSTAAQDVHRESTATQEEQPTIVRKSRVDSNASTHFQEPARDDRKSIKIDMQKKKKFEFKMKRMPLKDRLQKLEENRAAQLKSLKAKKRHDDKMCRFNEMNEKEREALREAFARFDIDDSGYLDHGELIACLREFGLCGTTGEEKRGILDISCEATCSDGEGEQPAVSSEEVQIDLLDLALVVVPRVRQLLVELRGDVLLKEFFKYDTDGSGKLSKSEMKELARGMGLDPRMLELGRGTSDADDDIDFESFQSMIIRGREQLQRVCRDREREVQKLAGLSEIEFQDYREDLVGLHDIFVRYDADSTSTLSKTELMFMLHETGLGPRNSVEQEDFALMIDRQDENHDEEFDFNEFLRLVQDVRIYRQEKRREELVERFAKYDKDKSGSLSSSEISLLLSDLGFVPKTRKEQEELAYLISSVDMDGSGQIDFLEFQDLSQRIDEKLKSFRYEEEIEVAMRLGFTEKQMRELRWVFDSLDTDGSQRLDAQEVRYGLAQMGKQITHEVFDTTFTSLDTDGSGELDFKEFLAFMKMNRDEEKEETQKLAKKPKELDGRVLRRVLEYFKLAKHYVSSLAHEELVSLFCEYFQIQPTDNLHSILEVKTVDGLYEAAQKRDLAMQNSAKS